MRGLPAALTRRIRPKPGLRAPAFGVGDRALADYRVLRGHRHGAGGVPECRRGTKIGLGFTCGTVGSSDPPNNHYGFADRDRAKLAGSTKCY